MEDKSRHCTMRDMMMLVFIISTIFWLGVFSRMVFKTLPGDDMTQSINIVQVYSGVDILLMDRIQIDNFENIFQDITTRYYATEGIELQDVSCEVNSQQILGLARRKKLRQHSNDQLKGHLSKLDVNFVDSNGGVNNLQVDFTLNCSPLKASEKNEPSLLNYINSLNVKEETAIYLQATGLSLSFINDSYLKSAEVPGVQYDDITATPMPTYSPTKHISKPTIKPSSQPSSAPSIPPQRRPLTKLYQLERFGTPVDGYYVLFNALAMNEDGTRMAIGASDLVKDGENEGAVRVFQHQDGVWDQIGSNITETNTTVEETFSMSFSPDGAWVAVGYKDSGQYSHVVAYHYSDEGWLQRGQHISEEVSHFGFSTSLSNHGKRLAIGSSNSVMVYQYDSALDTWNQLGDSILQVYHTKVDISADGLVVVVGSPYENNKPTSSYGTIKVFNFSSVRDAWNQVGNTLLGKNVGDFFGWSTSVSADGGRFVAGTLKAAYVSAFQYDLLLDEWTDISHGLNGGEVENSFGSSLSLSHSGDRLVVGSPFYSLTQFQQGRALLYQLDQGHLWGQIGDSILGDAEKRMMGEKVVIAPHGQYAAVSQNVENSGRVIVYRVEEVLR